MSELHAAKIDQEVRRHFAGIAQGAIDAMHIWCAAQTLIDDQGAAFRGNYSADLWAGIPEHLLTVLWALHDATETGDEPLSITWFTFRAELRATINLLESRYRMLVPEL